MNRHLGFLFGIFMVSVFMLSGCENSNIFSWAHDSGSGGSYESLMSDGNAAMKDKRYGKAAKYYKDALRKKPGDEEAIKGYSSALFADAVESQFSEIVNAAINTGSGTKELLESITPGSIGKIHDALSEILDPLALPAVANKPGASVDTVLNAAVANLIMAAAEISNDANLKNKIIIKDNYTIEYNGSGSDVEAAKTILRSRANTASAYLNRIQNESGSIGRTLTEHVDRLLTYL